LPKAHRILAKAWFIKQNLTLVLTLVLALRIEAVVLNCDVHKQNLTLTVNLAVTSDLGFT